MFTLSLGGTNPGPPKTCRGTIENPTAAEAVLPKNSRRETPLFSPVFNRFKSLISHLAAAILPILPQNVDASLHAEMQLSSRQKVVRVNWWSFEHECLAPPKLFDF
jgi:hypothetical protein